MLAALLAASVLGILQDVTVFENVTAVPMDGRNEPLVPGQTLVVRDGLIAAFGPAAEVTAPSDARVIDASGKYLMPGLTDAHVHIKYEHELALFIAFGVTTVRNMSGRERHVLWRDAIEAGARIGPTIMSAAATIDGPPIIWQGTTEVTNAEEATAAARAAKEHGWDYIKVYDSLSAESYAAIVAEAELPVVGHVPLAVGLDGVLAAGQHSLEHLIGYEGWLQPGGPVRYETRQKRTRGWHSIDRKRIPEAARITVESGAWNCPTMTMWFQVADEGHIEHTVTATEEFRFASRAQVEHWKWIANRIGAGIPIVRSANLARMQVLRGLVEGGARIVAGTDTGMMLVPAGRALHWELVRYVQAGMTPLQALESATVHAAECLGSDEFGSLRVGMRADLLLLDENPLEDVRNLTALVGVMARGRWFTHEALREEYEQISARGYASEPR